MPTRLVMPDLETAVPIVGSTKVAEIPVLTGCTQRAKLYEHLESKLSGS